MLTLRRASMTDGSLKIVVRSLLMLLSISAYTAGSRNSASGQQCFVSTVSDCTEVHRSTFNDLINTQSKSLLHGADAARILNLCNSHTAATDCLHNLKNRCPKLVPKVDEEARRLHNLTRLCQKIASTALLDTYSLHQRCLETKTRKAVDECWITFNGDTDGTLSPWAQSYPPRNAVSTSGQIAPVRSDVRTRKIHLAVCLLHQCLEEALRTKCDDSNTAYEKQASRLVNDLVSPLPPFSIMNINCTALKEEYETHREQNTPERQVSRVISSASSSLSSTSAVLLAVVAMTAFAHSA